MAEAYGAELSLRKKLVLSTFTSSQCELRRKVGRDRVRGRLSHLCHSSQSPVQGAVAGGNPANPDSR
jgi:hypothetical protein